jgi:hypothetical protein
MVIAQEKPTIATVTKTFVTLEEYRAIAETAEERYEYTEHGHKLRILKIRDNIVKIEKVVKRLRND